MKRITLGHVVRQARESKKLDRDQVAKRVGISSLYVGHIERDTPVHVSEDLMKKLVRTLSIRNRSVPRLRDRQNDSARRYYRAYRAKKAA